MNTLKYSKQALATVAFAAFASFQGTPSEAQSNNCAPRQVVLDRLAEKYGETQQSIGLQGSNVMLEVFANEETGTWSILLTRSDKISCLTHSGESYFETNKESAQGDPTKFKLQGGPN